MSGLLALLALRPMKRPSPLPRDPFFVCKGKTKPNQTTLPPITSPKNPVPQMQYAASNSNSKKNLETAKRDDSSSKQQQKRPRGYLLWYIHTKLPNPKKNPIKKTGTNSFQISSPKPNFPVPPKVRMPFKIKKRKPTPLKRNLFEFFRD